MLRRSLVPYALAVLIKLWLIADSPITPGYAPHDDTLFIRQALALLDGKWLGSFDHLTLSKGPFFAIWLAAMHVLSLPYVAALQISYLLACIVFLAGLRPIGLSHRWNLAVFAVLWFSPASFLETDFRVERSALYPSLTLLVVAFAIGLVLRCSRPGRVSIFWTVGLGASVAAFWLTREEGVWLLPALLLIFLAGLLQAVATRARDWAVVFRALALSTAVYFACLAAVAGANYFAYHRFLLISTRDSALVDAYRALTSVGENSPRLMVPASAQAIERAAAVSPALAEIHQAVLVGITGWRYYVKTGWLAMYPEGLVRQALTNDSDAIGGYFFWNFLAAVEQAGHYKNPTAAHNYFVRLARELHAACDSGRIPCRSSGEDPVPGWRSVPKRAFLASFRRALQMSLVFPGVSFPAECEGLDPALLNQFQRLIPSAIECRPMPRVSLKGWAAAKKGEVELSVTDRGNKVWQSTPRLSSPDVAAYLTGAEWRSAHPGNARFEAELPCAECELVVTVAGVPVKSAPASQWQLGCTVDDEWEICIDDALQVSPVNPRVTRMLTKIRRAVLIPLGQLYRYGVPAAALTFLLIALRRRRGIIDGDVLCPIFALACFVAVFTRAFILAWVDVVSFPSIVPQYTHGSYPLLLAGTLLTARVAIRRPATAVNSAPSLTLAGRNVSRTS